MTNDYDVIFIGSGHACWHGALILKQAGKKVALVERDLAGGTCTNYGCNAKVLLDTPFGLCEQVSRYQDKGVESTASVDWSTLMAYKKKVIGAMDPALRGLFSQMGFDVIDGHGKLADAHTVEVGGQKYTADYIVIGTGQNFRPLGVPGQEYIHDSREFLSLDVMPAHISFIGAGLISMELAQICLDCKAKVDIITTGHDVLGAYPRAYVDKIVAKMSNEGANFVYDANVSGVEKTGDSFVIKGTPDISIQTDYVLGAVGRSANVDNLGLEALGIEFSSRGIKVDDHLRTSVPNIYASGDVIDKAIPKLTPTAEYESNYIARDILNPGQAAISYPAIPNVAFTLPQIAQVGVSVEQAQADPAHYRIVSMPAGMSGSWANKAHRDEDFTFILDEGNRLVGAALYSDDAGMLIDYLTLVISQKLTLADLDQTIWAFPTATYMLVAALKQALASQ